MITFNNTKTLLELVKNIGKEFENNVFLRYERDDTIFEKGYGTFSMDTMSVAVYIEGCHSCMSARGIKKHNAKTVTTTLRGAFDTDSTLKWHFMMQAGK